MTRPIDWLLDWCFASLRDSAAYATGEGYAGDGYVYVTLQANGLGFKVHDHALAVSAQTHSKPHWATQPVDPEALRMMMELEETSAGPRTTYNAVRYFINNGKAPWWPE